MTLWGSMRNVSTVLRLIIMALYFSEVHILTLWELNQKKGKRPGTEKNKNVLSMKVFIHVSN